jgi:mono/diheme cytochrome c family protein
MNKVFIGLAATFMVAGLLPFALVAKSRATTKDARPVHLVLDMDKQPRGKAQRASEMFADNRMMRPHIEGTLAQEDLWLTSETLNDAGGTRPVLFAGGATSIPLSDPTTYWAVTAGRVRPAGLSDEDFAKIEAPSKEADIAADTRFYVSKIPAVFDVSQDMMKRGQERFTIYCAPCHGESGYGDGPVALRAAKLQTTPDAIGTWVAPQNLHEAKIIARPDGNLFNTITNGIRNMPAYDKQISIEDRWAVVAYIRALQRSQDAHPGDPGAK